jgi:TonB family protein
MGRKFACCLTLVLALIWTAFGQGELRKVSKAEARAAVLHATQPVYPPVARQMKVAGNVELEAVVSEEGNVEKVAILSGNPMLTRPCAEALKLWKFKAFLEDGKAVKVIAPVGFTFKVGE